MWNTKPCFRFEINNFSEKEAAISSETFVSGGCQWYVKAHPKGIRPPHDHLSLFLYVVNPESLQTGWEKSARFYFVVLNQFNKELYKSSMQHPRSMFCAKNPSYGFSKTMPLREFQGKGVTDKLIIEVYIDIDGIETVDINGFQMFASQVSSVKKIFADHPDIAEEIKLKNQVVKTEYMNVLLTMVNILETPPKSLTEIELSNACSDLKELMYAGFKVDWLKSKLEEIYYDGKKLFFVQERVKNIELMQASFKMDGLKSKLEEVSLTGKKANDDVQKLEERVKNLEVMESQLDEVLLERKKSYDDFGAQEERIKNLELMLSDLKVELEKEKAKSSDDGFVLVN